MVTVPKFPLPVQVAEVAVKVSLLPPLVKVIVALVTVCVPVLVHAEQIVVALSCALKVTVAVSFGSTSFAVPPPFARATAVGAVCVGVVKVKTGLVWVPCVACA